MTEETKKKIQKIAQTYGYKGCSCQCIEEMLRLSCFINKPWKERIRCGRRYDIEDYIGTQEKKDIKEGISNVIICIEQIKYLLMIKDDEIKTAIQNELDRQMERIEENA